MLGRASKFIPVSVTIFIQGLNSLSNLLITLYLVNFIGIDEFGYFAIAFMLAVNFTAVANALILHPINSVASQYSFNRQNEYISTAVAVSGLIVAGFLLLALLTYVAVGAINGDQDLVAAVGALCLAMYLSEFWRRVNFFRSQTGWVLSHDLLRYAFIILIFYIFRDSATFQHVVPTTLTLAASYLLSLLIISAARPPRYLVFPSQKRLRALSSRLVKSGKWLSISCFLGFLNTHTVIFVSFFALGATEVGVIRLAQSVVGLANPAIQALEHIVPRVLGQSIGAVGQYAALQRYVKLSILILIAFAMLFLAIALLTPLILKPMRIETLPGINAIISGFCTIYWISIVSNLVQYHVRASEDTQIIFKSLAITTSLALIIAYPSVAAFGVSGVILSIIASQILNIFILIPTFLNSWNYMRKR